MWTDRFGTHHRRFAVYTGGQASGLGGNGMTGLMTASAALVMGVLNDHSIAWASRKRLLEPARNSRSPTRVTRSAGARSAPLADSIGAKP